MNELEPIDPALVAGGSAGSDVLGGRVQRGPVESIAAAAGAGATRGGAVATTIAILGIADDRGITNGGGRAGAVLGPREIRRALYAMTCGGGGELEGLRIFDLGDATPGPAGLRSIEEVHALAEESIRAALVAGARVVVLGGGRDGSYASHSAGLRSIPADRKLAAINLGARCEASPLRDGTLITSATPFRRLRDRWGERYAAVQFGVQMQHSSRADVEWSHAQGWPVLELRRLRDDGIERRFLRQLTRARASAEALALSLDLGAVEAASAPGVSTPSPDGLAPAELLSLARDAGKESAVRLFDVMECAPPLDENGRTVRLAATAVWSFLAGVCES